VPHHADDEQRRNDATARWALDNTGGALTCYLVAAQAGARMVALGDAVCGLSAMAPPAP
jgi:hypothetical protein